MRTGKRFTQKPLSHITVNGCDIFIYHEGDQYRAVAYGNSFRGSECLLYTCRGDLPGLVEARAKEVVLGIVVQHSAH